MVIVHFPHFFLYCMLYKCAIFEKRLKKIYVYYCNFKIMASFPFFALHEVTVCVCVVDPPQLKQKENVSKVKKVHST